MRNNNKSLKMISDFKLIKTIGEGTFGKVKSAIQITTGQTVSIKILNKNRIKDKQNMERIMREIKILKSINHPNLLKLYQIIEDNQRYYLVTEYANNGELFDLIVSKKYLSENEASIFFTQLIYAIEYLQKNKISHRDIKPENLLIKNNKELILIDFGLSSNVKNEEFLCTPCGSPCYAAPEILLSRPYDGFASDIWSCGVVLYTMVCGYLPYEDDSNNKKLYHKMFSNKVQIPNRISEQCKDLINKMLVLNPKKRITLEEIKKHPFLSYGLIWYKEHFLKIFPKYELKSENINMDILENMQRYGVEESKEKIITDILNNKHNKITTIYYLLVEKYGLDWKYIDEDKCKLNAKPKNFVQIKRKTLSEDEESSCKLNESINNKNDNKKHENLKKNKKDIYKKLDIKKLDFTKLKNQSPLKSERINRRVLIRGENYKLINKINVTPMTNRINSIIKNSITINSTSLCSPSRKKDLMNKLKLAKFTSSIKYLQNIANENSLSIEMPISLTQIMSKDKNNKKLYVNNFLIKNKNNVNNHNSNKNIYISSGNMVLEKNNTLKSKLQKYATHSNIIKNLDCKKYIPKIIKKSKQYNTGVLYKKITKIDNLEFITNKKNLNKKNKISKYNGSMKLINTNGQKKFQKINKVNTCMNGRNIENKISMLSKKNDTYEQIAKSIELKGNYKKIPAMMNQVNV